MLNPNNELELFLATCIGLLGLACVGLDALREPSKLNLRHVAILMTASFFGLGPWICLMTGNGRLPDEPRDILWRAYSAVALFIVGIALVAGILNFSRGRKDELSLWKTISVADIQNWQAVLAIFAIVWAVRIFLAINYGIFFYGTGTGDRYNAIPYSVAVVQSILDPLGYGCYLWATVNLFRSESKISRLPVWFVASVSMAWFMTQGRRPIMIGAAILFFCYCSNYGRMRIRHFMYAVGVFLLLMGVVFPAFVRLRIAHERLGKEDNALVDFYQTFANAPEVTDEEVRAYSRENMTERPLIIRFACKILQSQEHLELMYGRAMLRSVVWTIPSVIYGDKRNTSQTETYIQEFYYHPVFDTSLTWPTTGVADFGPVGGLLYGLLLGVLIYAMEWWADKIKENYPIIAISALGGMLTLLCSVEDDPMALFCVFRAMAVVYIVAATLDWSGVFVRIAHARLEPADDSL